MRAIVLRKQLNRQPKAELQQEETIATNQYKRERWKCMPKLKELMQQNVQPKKLAYVTAKI